MVENRISREEVDAAVAGATIPRQFVQTVDEHPDVVALRWKDGEEWRSWTFTDYADRVARAMTGLQALGVGRGDRVAIMMRNRPEFHVADIATLMLGATPYSIYNSSSPEQIEFLVSHGGATFAVVEDAGFLERFQKARAGLPDLKTIVVVEPDETSSDDAVSWESVLDAEPGDLRSAATTAEPDDLATIIYTSGTTGPPKGVMITHYNVCWVCESERRLLDREFVGSRTISYLPMAHIAERTATHYLGIVSGQEVTTCPDASKIAEYAREVQPQTLFGVPRVFEKLYNGVNASLAADPEKNQKFNEALEAAKPLALARATGERELSEEEEQTLAFLDEVAFKPVRQLLGLDELDVAVTGAAPMVPEMLEWFVTIGVPLSEIYGMSENTGPLNWDPYRIKPGTVGRPLPGCTVELAPDGEIIAKGGNIFKGYLNDEERTAETLADGWLHTGDIGEIDDEGYLRIVDRKKELIITAGGKNISPANLEASLKMVPLIGQACAIGDKRPFVSALVVLDPDAAASWAAAHGREGASLAELAADPEVKAEIERGVDDVMQEFNQAERVKKVVVLGEEWLPDSEELTPTSKLKRRGIHAKYASEIEALYA